MKKLLENQGTVGPPTEPPTAVELVAEWEIEWLYSTGPHWGDELVWSSAHEIAKRIDEIVEMGGKVRR